MRLLLTNDDGIDAPGLAALEAAARELGQAMVIAPATGLSGCGHRVTTDTHFEVAECRPGRFALHGTPADCVRAALWELLPEPDWVLSGINAGGNLGADVYISGTVAAVREAALHGKPGVALSQYRKRGLPVDWEQSARWAAAVLAELARRPRTLGAFWNVNLPHLEAGAATPEIVFCPLDPHPLPLGFHRDGPRWRYAGDYHSRQRQPGADVDTCFRGRIAVTEIRLLG